MTGPLINFKLFAMGSHLSILVKGRIFFSFHTSHLFPCLPTDGVARIFNLLIELARAPFQHVWVQFMCILTPFAREGETTI